MPSFIKNLPLYKTKTPRCWYRMSPFSRSLRKTISAHDTRALIGQYHTASSLRDCDWLSWTHLSHSLDRSENDSKFSSEFVSTISSSPCHFQHILGLLGLNYSFGLRGFREGFSEMGPFENGIVFIETKSRGKKRASRTTGIRVTCFRAICAPLYILW